MRHCRTACLQVRSGTSIGMLGCGFGGLIRGFYRIWRRVGDSDGNAMKEVIHVVGVVFIGIVVKKAIGLV